MRGDPVVLRVAGVALCAVAPLACGLTDLFAPTGPQEVQLIWQGPTDLAAGDTVPLSIGVTVGGVLLESPHVRVTVLSTTVLALTSGGDSVIALRSGQGDIEARFENSLLGRSGPDTVFTLRVTGGPL